jgi:hypothetical protein
VNRVKFTVNSALIRSKTEDEAVFWSFPAPRGKAPGVQQSPVNLGLRKRVEP